MTHHHTVVPETAKPTPNQKHSEHITGFRCRKILRGVYCASRSRVRHYCLPHYDTHHTNTTPQSSVVFSVSFHHHTHSHTHTHTHTHTNTRTQHTRPTTVIEDLQGPKPQLAASRQRIIVRHCTNHIIDAAGTNRPFKQLTVAHAEDTSEVPPACRDLYPFACTRYALISPLFLCVRVYRLSEQASENNVNGPAALQAPDRAFEDYQGCYRPDY